jgi:hypothetical protein
VGHTTDGAPPTATDLISFNFAHCLFICRSIERLGVTVGLLESLAPLGNLLLTDPCLRFSLWDWQKIINLVAR